MTRPNKHAARFGDRYRPPIDWRRFRDGLQKAQPAIHAITAVLRRISEGLQDRSLIVVPSQTQPGRLAVVPRELEWSPLGYASEDGIGWAATTRAHAASPEFRAADQWIRSQPIWPASDILDRIDDDLLAYDAQRSTGEPWPFESF